MLPFLLPSGVGAAVCTLPPVTVSPPSPSPLAQFPVVREAVNHIGKKSVNSFILNLPSWYVER